MEKKERYELIGYCSYRDTETGVIGDNFVELLNQQDKKIAELKKALELVCSDAHETAIECEGYYFGACSEKTFNWFEDLSKEEKIKAHCNYFLNKAKEMLENESK